MNKINKIIKREYITRVRKRSFIIMTILGPILFAAFMIVPIWLSQLEDSGVKTIAVVEIDSNGNALSTDHFIFKDVIPSNENLNLVYLNNIDTSDIEMLIENTDYYGILVINQKIQYLSQSNVKLYTRKQPSIGIEAHIVKALEDYIYDRNLLSINLSPEKINALKVSVTLQTNKYDKGEFKEQTLVNIKRGIGYASGFLIYFFIFFFGAQVMRGVIEEKTNRIVEVIITSVKPFQLMMGKITGIALVALTQFVIWVVLTLSIYQYALTQFFDRTIPTPTEQSITQNIEEQEIAEIESVQMNAASDQLSEVFSRINVDDMLLIIGSFLFYFMGGYLLYAAMFAAVGSAVDSETDTQQFILPVTIPLIISIMVMINAITNPEGQLVYWFSMIPFTSPVVMMARIPFKPPIEELLLSMSLLIITFIIMTWLAAKIYRVGILMYGKKTSYRELIKWITYRD
ncbi:MAG: ABC transporter permease [Bacteroidales bacterium]|nr:ABC transporter permease [Bacteroidales bacterium]